VDGWNVIRGILGEGAGSVVYEAADGVIDETVAIKVLRSTDSDPRARFALEGRVLRGFSSPHVPAVHLIGELPDGSPYIVMERVSETLADRLVSVSLDLDEVFEIGQQLLAACTVVHERGIVHRDIKPSNIGLLGSTGNGLSLKLIDFGVCVVLGTTDDSKSSHDTLIGTPEYMAPEQVTMMFDVDARTDIYSVGVVLYESITGRMPFQGGNFEEVVAAVLEDPILSPAAIRPDCSPALENVVVRALSRDMNERFQTAAEMASALTDARTLSGAHPIRQNGRRRVATRVTANATTVHPLVRRKVEQAAE
jgi:serine/threonine-protein kinase